jgi:D-3-phosphoglycerate dehydrogenase / 2-oxoglutarate reductase
VLGPSRLSRPRVLIYRPVDESGSSHRVLEAAGCDVVVAPASAGRDALIPLARDVDALLGATFRGQMDRAFLTLSPRLRLVAKYTIGVDDVDVDVASSLGILVTHCPTEANWGGVAEGAVALMLALLKRVRERDLQVKAGGWREPPIYGTYVGKRADGYAGITIGIVGLGRAGARVADLLRPWGARVLAADPYVEPAKFARHGVERVELEALLRDADVVTLHCNLTAETRGLIDRRRLALLKPTAMLVNTARGAIVDLEALCAALESRAFAAAALDVLPEEPPPADARLLRLGERVLLSPHMIAANQGGTLGAAIPWAAEAVLAALRGEVPERVYNTDAVAKWQARFGHRPLLPGDR